MPARAANGRFVKSGTRSRSSRSSRTATAIVVAAPRSPARRSRSSSPVVVASRRRRSRNGGGAYSPPKSFAAGGVLGVATTKFAAQYNRLPEVGGTRMIALTGLIHLGRDKIPHGRRLAESAASIAGWEAGKANAARLGVEGGDDDF
jgi:hypothetical protein